LIGIPIFEDVDLEYEMLQRSSIFWINKNDIY